ncbi:MULTISPECIES: ABC transporter permease [Lysinibacillus]|uniref:ABC transporter permease n=1 Tax=Lysinibacillus fusiformis TaxID=28031 RepID=A0A2I0UVL1_9BACI|nr:MULTISPECIES: ABC transporter permease [Lysinibacillus]PKU50114.1 ABC transporter permease [Lysinibacillus fusiformis]WCH48104.1 ABC transporter permease [Lysinibacillus sp. OF-1]
MNFSMTRIQAILVKDYKEFSRNYAVSTMVLLPLIMAYLYNQSGSNSISIYFLPINMAFAVVTTYVQCCLIAEEKEKNTLRSLMLSPASLGDILIGKSLFVLIITILAEAVTIFLVGYEPANLFIIVIALLLSALFYIALGTICGLFAKSIMEASIIVLPVMLIFSFGPFALALSSVNPILKIAEWLPSSQLLLLAEALEGSYSMPDVVIPLLTIIVWTLVSWFFAAVIYKKRMVD